MTTFQVPPIEHADDKEHRRQLATAVLGLFDGKHNATGTFTLTANGTTSTLTDPRIGGDTKVLLTPTTANAATAMTAVFQTYPNAAAEAAVFTHDNTADSDRTFAYSLAG